MTQWKLKSSLYMLVNMYSQLAIAWFPKPSRHSLGAIIIIKSNVIFRLDQIAAIKLLSQG